MRPSQFCGTGANRPLITSVGVALVQSSKTPLLDRILFPNDLKNLSADQLKQLADELRTETVDAVANTGGHLALALASSN